VRARSAGRDRTTEFSGRTAYFRDFNRRPLRREIEGVLLLFFKLRRSAFGRRKANRDALRLDLPLFFPFPTGSFQFTDYTASEKALPP
jgi:hypothetical protein